MNKLEKIISLFENAPLTDIWLAGFLDEDEKPYKIFHAMQSTIYLEFGDIFLRCAEINQYDQLAMDIVTEITIDFDIDEDDEFCISSIIEPSVSYLHKDYYITNFRALIGETSNLKEGIVKYLELRFDNGDTILLDPINLFGIRISSQLVLNDLRLSALNSIIADLLTENRFYNLYTWDKYTGLKMND
jgi:hypothetical protein